MPRPAGASQRLPRCLTQIEVRAFFQCVTEPRDRALFALIYHYGLRVGEVALLVRGDVDFERSRIVVKRLKGGAWTERPLFVSSSGLLRAGCCHDKTGRGEPEREEYQMARNDRTVSQRDDGSWANKRDGNERASSLHRTQLEAGRAAREMLENSGGGELKVKDENGRIRSKDTIPSGNDPNPPRDTEH